MESTPDLTSPPPQEQVFITADNVSPLITIFVWFFLSATVLSVGVRTIIQVLLRRSLNVENYLIFASLVFAIGQSVAVDYQTVYGLGRPFRSLTPSDVDSELKAGYASVCLLIASLGFAKLSVSFFIGNLTPNKLHRQINHGCTALVAAWFLTAEFSALFQCRLPRTWDHITNRCIDRTQWWYYVAIFNIITDVAQVSLEIGITATLQINLKRKAMVIAIFSGRYAAPIIATVQLIYFDRDTRQSPDPTLGFWRSTVLTQAVQCLSVATTSLPHFKTLMDIMETGLYRIEDKRSRSGIGYSGKGYSGGSGSGGAGLSSGHSGSGFASKSRSASGRGVPQVENQSYELTEGKRLGRKESATITTTTTTGGYYGGRGSGGPRIVPVAGPGGRMGHSQYEERSQSQVQLRLSDGSHGTDGEGDRDAIMQTREWKVEVHVHENPTDITLQQSRPPT